MTIRIEISDSDQLTWTARCVAGFRAQGHTNNQIAEIMHVHRHTIERAVKALRAAGVTLGKPSLTHSHNTPQIGGDPQNRGTPNKVHSTPQSETLQSPNVGVGAVGTQLALSDPDSSSLFPDPSKQITHEEEGESEGERGANGRFSESVFQEFYQAYPRHKAVDAARKRYKTVIKAGVNHEAIMTGVEQYKLEIQRNNTEAQHVAYPATWLNQGGWKDEYGSNWESEGDVN